ncbi:NADH-dependent butanol dehydrogenase A [bioreactor metagenome]|uniref:NADH-dependent butanol dehydrogenase A n=2 Tax=root TaxID=1 RepID=A0A645BP91_9ZZZZ|nr:iron-containing alcohol dehydrogenase [Sphaerochaeta associata]MEA5029998.1 iron-containing alcohol dehydrogenase [Sphaerochaeta associata]MEA5108227.1 iron-containing alcohol dehydrogenase [Sphaerochaeta associata]
MESFDLLFPTHIHFGRDVVDQVGEAVKGIGTTVMVVFGQNSVIRSGLYARVEQCLIASGCTVVRGGGVLPNPTYAKVLALSEVAREHQVDCLLALGGGSVIDTAKALAGLLVASDPKQYWTDHFENYKPVVQALPLAVVLTIPASGSETSDSCVISDTKTGMKRIASGSALTPRASLLDPTLTLNLPTYQTACGICDMLSHLQERYFIPLAENNLTDRILESVMRHIIDNGPLVLSHPDSYHLRSEIMWAGTLAHSTLLDRGRGGGDWACHMIEHALSGFCEVAHGAGLAILIPAWLRYVAPLHPQIFLQYAFRVWHIELPLVSFEDVLERLIYSMKSFYRGLGLPTQLREIGIEGADLPAIAQAAAGSYPIGSLQQLDAKQVLDILQLAF